MELESILTSDNVVDSINRNQEYLFKIMPELKDMIGFDQMHPHHHLDVWNHTLYALSLSIPDFEVRLALLLHDIGKPHSYQEVNGIRHFRGHAGVSSDMALQILSRLDINESVIYRVSYLIEYHDIPITISDINNNYDLTCKRYEIQRCDALAHHPEKLEKRKDYLERTKKLLTQPKV